MMSSETLIVSPSGNWYGSEQVLYGHLQNTSRRFTVYVPKKGPFRKKLSETEHSTRTFQSTPFLYIRLFFCLLSGTNTLYVNEGGHVRYVNLLAAIFRNRTFVVHVRLVEDTAAERIRLIRPNVHFVCVSDFIRQLIVKSFGEHDNVQTIHDYVLKPDAQKEYTPECDGVIRIGVVGRVSKRKGILQALELAKSMSRIPAQSFRFSFFGGVVDDEDVRQFTTEMESIDGVQYEFRGFVMDQSEIYDHVDCIIHFNAFEPFPRIYFESVCNLKPIIGFASGGVGEQAEIMGLSDLLVEPGEDWPTEMIRVVQFAKSNYPTLRSRLLDAWNVFDTRLNIQTYVDRLESLFDLRA